MLELKFNDMVLCFPDECVKYVRTGSNKCVVNSGHITTVVLDDLYGTG